MSVGRSCATFSNPLFKSPFQIPFSDPGVIHLLPNLFVRAASREAPRKLTSERSQDLSSSNGPTRHLLPGAVACRPIFRAVCTSPHKPKPPLAPILLYNPNKSLHLQRIGFESPIREESARFVRPICRAHSRSSFFQPSLGGRQPIAFLSWAAHRFFPLSVHKSAQAQLAALATPPHNSLKRQQLIKEWLRSVRTCALCIHRPRYVLKRASVPLDRLPAGSHGRRWPHCRWALR